MKKHSTFIKGALCGALIMFIIVAIGACSDLEKYIPFLSSSQESTTDPIDDTVEKKIKSLQQYINVYYLGDVDEESLQEGIYAGFIAGLNDPYSVYYTKEETNALYEMTTGEYSGIGAVLSQDASTGIISIARVYSDSPANEAGFMKDDLLYKVDGEEVTGIDINTVVTWIKGLEGSEVEITVLRGDDMEEITQVLKRRKIQIETVEYEMLAGKIGYLLLSEFDGVSYTQYVNAIEDLKSQGMKGLIVDLRDNGGGSLSTVIDILDYMLPEGLIVYTEDKNGHREEANSDEANQFNLPLVVLVNGYTASASEIYAGAIQDYELGTIVGEQTYGKGVVQQIFDLDDGTSVKLTISQYFTPKGRSIQGEGITPDVVVEYVRDEDNEEADNQLDKAIEVIKTEF
ncbi:MAG: S41 family peptidase [Lachnospiraceae bacterium]|jgi:carboxyl-terminal processing protease|nr:S41 family peptidase [Lachnospiraceae bacterium]